MLELFALFDAAGVVVPCAAAAVGVSAEWTRNTATNDRSALTTNGSAGAPLFLPATYSCWYKMGLRTLAQANKLARSPLSWP